MYAMPRKNLKSTAKALLAIPSSDSGAVASQTERSVSSIPTSLSMTLPAQPYVIRPTTSCHSSPGNAHDAYRTIVDLPPPRATNAPDIRPAEPPDVAIEREDWKQLFKSKNRYAMLRKAIGFLHDNRAVSSKHPNTARRLREINAELRADNNCRVLKFILNAVFILIGLLLLLSVLAAIGYTSTVPHDTKDDVVEKFLSKILPGSGTVARFDPSYDSSYDRSSRLPADEAQPTDTRRTAKHAPAADATAPSPVAANTTRNEQRQTLRGTQSKRKIVCKMVPMEKARNENDRVPMKQICFHVSV